MKRSSFLKSTALVGAGTAAAGSGLGAFKPVAEALAASSGRSLSSIKFSCIVKTVNSDYWAIVLAAAKKAAADLGIKGLAYTGANAESNFSGEVDLIGAAVTQKPDFVVIAPSDKTAINGAIGKAYDAGIKVILVDSAATTTKFQAFLSTDNHAAGMLCADALAAAIKAKTGSASGQVAYATFLSNVGSLGQRDQGFLDGLKKYPELKIVSHKDAGGDPTVKSVSIAADTLVAFPNLVGYFADNLYTLTGAVTAFASKKVDMKKVSLVGFDSNQALVADLAAGTVDGLLLQDPYMMGYGGVLYGLLATLGVKVPNFLDTGATVAVKSNMNGPLVQGLLLPLGKPGRGLGL